MYRPWLQHLALVTQWSFAVHPERRATLIPFYQGDTQGLSQLSEATSLLTVGTGGQKGWRGWGAPLRQEGSTCRSRAHGDSECDCEAGERGEEWWALRCGAGLVTLKTTFYPAVAGASPGEEYAGAGGKRCDKRNANHLKALE